MRSSRRACQCAHYAATCWPALLLSVALLALVRVPSLGRTVNGNTNWLGLGPFTLQPAEIAKLALVLWAAHAYAAKERQLTRVHHMLMPVGTGAGAMIALVVLGRDLGTALVLFTILLAMLWVIGAPGRLFTLVLSAVCALALYLTVTAPHRLDRITNFARPFNDDHITGRQPAHGLYALASGGLSGQGIGASREKWGTLPDAHTDLILAVLGEELGLVGTLLVLVLYLAIAHAGIRVAIRTIQPFARYAAFGIVAWLLGQVMIINVGMVLRCCRSLEFPCLLSRTVDRRLCPRSSLSGYWRISHAESGLRNGYEQGLTLLRLRHWGRPEPALTLSRFGSHSCPTPQALWRSQSSGWRRDEASAPTARVSAKRPSP